MKEVYTNYLVDAGLTVSFAVVLITGIMKWPGLQKAFSFSIKQVKMMTLVHDWGGAVMSLLVIIHVILHWRWIVTITKSIFKNKKR